MQNIRWFNILWTSSVDGPGTRAVLYLRGCYLRCPWCHSPHSWDKEPPLLFFQERCVQCGACVSSCKYGVHRIEGSKHLLDRDRCLRCGECVRVCPVGLHNDQLSGALALAGFEDTPLKLYQKLSAQLMLLKRIGGLTVSGGEPLLQSEALQVLLQACRKKGIHTAVETSGALPLKNFKNLLEFVDCWLFGLRPLRKGLQINGLVGDWKTVNGNLAFLSKMAAGEIIIRMPLIPGMTSSVDCLEMVAGSLLGNGLAVLELLPLNPYMSHYYRAIGEGDPLAGAKELSDIELQKIQLFFEKKDIQARIVR